MVPRLATGIASVFGRVDAAYMRIPDSTVQLSVDETRLRLENLFGQWFDEREFSFSRTKVHLQVT